MPDKCDGSELLFEAPFFFFFFFSCRTTLATFHACKQMQHYKFRKAQKQLDFSSKCNKVWLKCQVLVNVYDEATESCQTGYVTNMAWDGEALQRVIKTGQNITGTHLEGVRDICELPAQSPKETKYNTHPGHRLFILPPSGKRSRSICCWTTELQSSFLPPGWGTQCIPHTPLYNSFYFCNVFIYSSAFILCCLGNYNFWFPFIVLCWIMAIIMVIDIFALRHSHTSCKIVSSMNQHLVKVLGHPGPPIREERKLSEAQLLPGCQAKGVKDSQEANVTGKRWHQQRSLHHLWERKWCW